MNTVHAGGREYGLASLGERLLAQFLDALIYLAIAIVPAFVVTFPLGNIIGVVAAVLYLLFQDGLRGGQSWGKRVTRSAVIDADSGQWCSFWQSFWRNLLLVVLGFVDWVFVFGPRRQRLGDLLARTLVVKLDDLPAEPAAESVPADSAATDGRLSPPAP